MDDYREYVTGVARIADGRETILNKTTAHASVLMEALFKKAEHEVRILSGGLDDRAYGTSEVIKAAHHFLAKPGTRLTIIVERPVQLSASAFLTALRSSGMFTGADDSRVQLLLAKNAHPFHFALADDRHYRFESDTQRHEAIAQFGVAVEETEKLRNAFNAIVRSAVKLFPQE